VLKTIGRPRVAPERDTNEVSVVMIVLGIPFRYCFLFFLLFLFSFSTCSLVHTLAIGFPLVAEGVGCLSFRRKTREKLGASRRIPGCEKKRESARARETRVSWYPRDGRSNVLGRPTAQKRRRQQDERARTNDVIVQLTTAG